MVLSFYFVPGGVQIEKCLYFLRVIVVIEINMGFKLPLCLNSFHYQIPTTLFYAGACSLADSWHVGEG